MCRNLVELLGDDGVLLCAVHFWILVELYFKPLFVFPDKEVCLMVLRFAVTCPFIIILISIHRRGLNLELRT